MEEKIERRLPKSPPKYGVSGNVTTSLSIRWLISVDGAWKRRLPHCKYGDLQGSVTSSD